ncbi:hypothetical protein [Planomicrobium sp. CPCC 101079]|uniref:hypothetical protein n=1 Tax=Planomicrobium sp. CPCC 101079 TaxID=2599618 RepID=UPI0011B7343E|nr:hypothetical protein [Planomicrobium sp. CPCC 101079]TWT00141.1 hypothetical protein FQV28_18665 [Planomicrobium sp. CPCC 101079]
MKGLKSPLVIAIAGVSGGGKTTIVARLTEQLQKSKALFFDDYELEGPENVLEWVGRGSNYDEWNLKPFIKDLEELLTEPLDYILLDFPFAYQHSQTREFIDFTVFIDTPLDIALARRTVRDFKYSSVEEIMVQMEHYAIQGRLAYLKMLETIKPNSDLVIDGTLSIAEITNLIIENCERVNSGGRTV